MQFVLLLIGLVSIIKSADILIESTIKIGKRYQIPSIILGIIIIAFGTSLPEFIVGLFSGINGTNALALGDVMGSSIVNICIVIGIAALIRPFDISINLLKKDLLIFLFICILLSGLVLIDGELSRIDGIILIALFIFYMCSIFRLSNNDASDSINVNNQKGDYVNPVWLWGALLLSLIGMIIGGNFVVTSSEYIASSFGISEDILGFTIIALATSLPEILTGIAAVRKKQPELLIGNCIGSNIFNMLLVLGTTTIINPIQVNAMFSIDMLALIFVSIMLMIVIYKSARISRISGGTFILCYLGLILYKIVFVLQLSL
ncbi:calcium/sodium antiporter [Culicoidibacter larvae]|uniref:Calcium/sodium antiporter n=1 Tax=Culicoidibacter larvae TaxID=2579976 RepID=A0A5R8QE14_9FIRM|nr:calcium/sodium antiporter [Culicoidibacter larvae]TLG75481.1 calcium/sodium antiporter [Culicoidibacter larvae]